MPIPVVGCCNVNHAVCMEVISGQKSEIWFPLLLAVNRIIMGRSAWIPHYIGYIILDRRLFWIVYFADFEANKKEFWSFVGRRTKGRKGGVEALRNDSGVSVTSTKGKLKVLQSHYQRLGSCSVDDAFDGNWKQEVDSEVNECHRCSVEHDDPVLDREIEL